MTTTSPILNDADNSFLCDVDKPRGTVLTIEDALWCVGIDDLDVPAHFDGFVDFIGVKAAADNYGPDDAFTFGIIRKSRSPHGLMVRTAWKLAVRRNADTASGFELVTTS